MGYIYQILLHFNMDKLYKVLIQISGKYASVKHARELKNYLNDNLQDKDNILIRSRVNENYNFNITIEGEEIFAKRRFWNKYPRYQTILNKINGFIKEKQVYSAMKASYQLQNELY